MDVRSITKAYADAFGKGLIPILACRACGHRFHVVRTRCPRCGSTDLEVETREIGVVYSYTIIERGVPTKAALVVVDLGGVRVKGNYVGDLSKLRVGATVRAKAYDLGQIKGVVFVDA